MQSSGKGDVELSVTLDTSGLKKETEKIKAEIEKGVATSNTEIKPQTDVKPIQIIVQQAKQASTALQQTTATANSVVKEMEEAGNKVPTEEFAALSQNAAWLEKELEKTNAQLDHMELINEDATPKFSKMAEKALELENALAKAKDQMQAMIELGEAFQVVNVEQDDLAQREAELARLQAILDKNKEAASEFAAEMQNVATASEEVVTSFSYENPLEKTKLPDQFTDEIENAQEVIEQTQEEAVEEFEDEYARFIEYIQAAEEKAREMADTLEGLRDVGADPDDIAEMESEYDTLIEKIALMKQSIQIGSTAWNEMEVNEKLSIFAYKLAEGFKHLASVVGTTAVNAFKKFYATLGEVAKRIGKFAINKLVSGFKKLAPQINKTNNGLGIGIKKILGYAIGIRSLFALFSKLRSAIKEGIDNLAQWRDGNNEVNENLSALISSLLQLKNQLAAAFAPIINIVIPILNNFIDALIDAMNYLSQFIATLAGQDTWIKALKVQKNYADSLNKTGKAAKDASGKLAKFDDLDVLNQKDSGNGSYVDPNDMFEEMPLDQVETNVNDWIEKLKKAWETSDFSDFGAAVGAWIRDALASVPWGSIQEMAQKIAHSVATLLNGFFETEGLGKQIGKTLAQAFRTAFVFISSFVHTLHWDSIGKFIGESLVSFIEEFPWEEAGEALGGAFVGIITLAYNMVKTFTEEGGWQSLVDGILTFVSTFIEELDAVGDDGLTGWQRLGETIYLTIHGVLTSLTQLINEFPIGELMDRLLQVVKAAKPDQLVSDFIQFAKSIVVAITTAIKKISWVEVGNTIGEKFGEAVQELGPAIIKLTAYMTGAAIEVILGFINGLKNSGTNMLKVAWESLWSVVIEWFDSLFRIDSPSKLMYEKGEFVVEGFINGVEALKDKIYELWQKIKEGVVQKVWDMRDGVVGWVENIKRCVVNVFDALKDKIISIWDKIKDGIKSPLNAIIAAVETMVNAFVKALNKLIDGINELGTMKMPDWAKKLGVQDISLNIPRLQEVSLPKLAQGAVIPPNREFMAVLGDQPSGTNIEAPLETIKEALAEVMGNQTQAVGNAVMQLDGQTFARLVTPYVVSELGRRGYDVKVIGA